MTLAYNELKRWLQYNGYTVAPEDINEGIQLDNYIIAPQGNLFKLTRIENA